MRLDGMNPMLEDSTDVPLEGMAQNLETTAKAKRRILREADALSKIGGISEWLRRESRCGETAHRDLAGGTG